MWMRSYGTNLRPLNPSFFSTKYDNCRCVVSTSHRTLSRKWVDSREGFPELELQQAGIKKRSTEKIAYAAIGVCVCVFSFLCVCVFSFRPVAVNLPPWWLCAVYTHRASTSTLRRPWAAKKIPPSPFLRTQFGPHSNWAVTRRFQNASNFQNRVSFY